ncbi:MAG: amino acid ABC transporter ATP-binding protein, partial [Butyrivibrio sp.]|nr:amino acid ABC transporter ATP-binding protein [Butyrivibrio sp.]
MIKVKNIHKRFKDNIVLDGVSFDIEKGDVIAIIGPSGTGKSTLLRSINLLEHPEEGEIEFDDFLLDYGNHKKKDELDLRKKTTMVFQQFNLFQKKTALENVMEGLMVVQKLPKSEAKKIAIEKLRQVKMDDRLDYYPKHLSGGQQQRVA